MIETIKQLMKNGLEKELQSRISFSDTYVVYWTRKMRLACIKLELQQTVPKNIKTRLGEVASALKGQCDAFRLQHRSLSKFDYQADAESKVRQLSSYMAIIDRAFESNEFITSELKDIKADTDTIRAAVDELSSMHEKIKSELVALISLFERWNNLLEPGWFSIGRELLIRRYEALSSVVAQLPAPVIKLYNLIVYCFKVIYAAVFEAVIFVKSAILTAQPNMQSNSQDSSNAEQSSALSGQSISEASANNAADENSNVVPNDTSHQAMAL